MGLDRLHHVNPGLDPTMGSVKHVTHHQIHLLDIETRHLRFPAATGRTRLTVILETLWLVQLARIEPRVRL